MALSKNCPGAIKFREPIPEYIDCPECGEETEIWSHEPVGECHLCGATLYKDSGPSCLDWCDFAEECVGAEEYDRLMQERKVARERMEASF